MLWAKVALNVEKVSVNCLLLGLCLSFAKWWYQNSDVAALAWKKDIRDFERRKEGFSCTCTLGVQNRVLKIFMFGS